MKVAASPASQEAHLVDVHVGQQLRHRRALAKLSQTVVADHLGVSFQQVQKYERGSNRIGAGRLYQLGKVLGVDVQSFFDGLGPRRLIAAADTELDTIMEFASSREGLALYRAYLAAPSSARKLAVNVLRLGSEGRR